MKVSNKLLLGLGTAAFTFFIYPGRFSYFEGEVLIRVDRITGTAEFLTRKGWVREIPEEDGDSEFDCTSGDRSFEEQTPEGNDPKHETPSQKTRPTTDLRASGQCVSIHRHKIPAAGRSFMRTRNMLGKSRLASRPMTAFNT